MTTLSQHARDIRAKLIDVAEAEGFDGGTSGAEPKAAPVDDHGIHCSVMEGTGRALPLASTLAYTSVEITSIVHLYRRIDLGDGGDEGDEVFEPELTDARDTLLAALHGDVDLGQGRQLNPLGMHGGTPWSWQPAYLEIDHRKYRTQAITVSAIVHNAWEQVA